MPKYEYLIDYFEKEINDMESERDYLDRRGSEGWRLVSVTDNYRSYYFVRSIEINPKIRIHQKKGGQK